MKKQRSISLETFATYLQQVIGQPIWRVIHPADGWLILDLGRKYQDSISDSKGVEHPYPRGEVSLMVQGSWIYIGNSAVIQKSAALPGESWHKYFTRVEQFAEEFPFKTFTKVALDGSNACFWGEGQGRFIIKPNGFAETVALTCVSLDQAGKPRKYDHYRVEEETGLTHTSIELYPE